jgi:DNA-binding transcriptional ArsR family regulator
MPEQSEERAVAKVQTRSVDKRQAYLRRLAIVYGDDLRMKIVSELFQREMSPKQFFEEFGGGSISRVDQHFKRLEEYGWLRYVRKEGPGGRRYGAAEHFYRAPELAIIDDETYAIIPHSARLMMNWRIFRTFAERVREALVAGTLDVRPESHLGCATMNLDRSGWEQIVGAANALFESIFEEQGDARLRIFHTGEKPMVATVALVVFESPSPLVLPPSAAPELIKLDKEPAVPFPNRISKVLADQLARNILAEANMRKISAPLFHTEIGNGSIAATRRCFKALEERSWLQRVEEKTGGKRRAGREKFYRATGPATSNNETWVALPPSVQPTPSWETFGCLADLVREAVDAGTFANRSDMHISWSALRLDQEGWERVAKGVDELQTLIREEKSRAEDRLAKSEERPIPTTIGIAAFESPKSAIKAP